MSRGHYGASARNQYGAGVGYDSSWGADNSHRGEALRVVADLAKKEWSRKPIAFGYMLRARDTIVQAFTEGPANDPFWYAKDWFQNAVPRAGYIAWFDARDLTKPRAEHFGTVTMTAGHGAPSTSIQGHGAYVGEESPSPPPEDQKHAATLAQRTHENFVGVVLNSGVLGKWEVRGFPSKEALENWYAAIAYKKPADYDYVAAFDKNRYGAKPYGSSWSPSRARKKTLSRGLIIGGVVVGGALLARSFLVPSRSRGNGSR